jgi:hypothetical protein
VNREIFWTSYQEDSKKQIVLQLDFQRLISRLVSRAGSDDSRQSTALGLEDQEANTDNCQWYDHDIRGDFTVCVG